MDYSQYENYGFDRVSAFNLSTGYQERSYQAHWHSYGGFVLVGPGDTNIFTVNQKRYELVEGDFLLVWPMEMHSIIHVTFLPRQLDVCRDFMNSILL